MTEASTKNKEKGWGDDDEDLKIEEEEEVVKESPVNNTEGWGTDISRRGRQSPSGWGDEVGLEILPEEESNQSPPEHEKEEFINEHQITKELIPDKEDQTLEN